MFVKAAAKWIGGRRRGRLFSRSNVVRFFFFFYIYCLRLSSVTCSKRNNASNVIHHRKKEYLVLRVELRLCPPQTRSSDGAKQERCNGVKITLVGVIEGDQLCKLREVPMTARVFSLCFTAGPRMSPMGFNFLGHNHTFVPCPSMAEGLLLGTVFDSNFSPFLCGALKARREP